MLVFFAYGEKILVNYLVTGQVFFPCGLVFFSLRFSLFFLTVHSFWVIVP